MKKYLLIATVALGLSVAACTGGTKSADAQPTDAAQPAVTATTDSAAVSVSQDSVAAPKDTTAVAPAAKQ